MPPRDPAAKRYADAVFAIADDSGTADRWAADLDDLVALFADADAAAFFVSTRVAQADKERVIDQAMADAADEGRNLAKLLVRKRRTRLAEHIRDAFRTRLNSERGIAAAVVTTAVPLSDDARASVEAAVRGYTNADTVQLTEAVDSAILGGAVLRIGDRIIDGSVRTRLNSLRRAAAGGNL